MALTRREFLGTSLALTTMSALDRLSMAQNTKFHRPATVVKIVHSQVLNEDGTPDPQIYQQMVHAGLTALTQTENERAAWGQLVSSQDKITLKINTLGLGNLPAPLKKHIVTGYQSIVASLSEIRVTPSDLVVWDMREGHLKDGGLKPGQKDDKGILCKAAELCEYDVPFSVGGRETQLTSILTKETTALISICQAKSHGIAGITGALKTHYGTINNPYKFHENHCCNPGIAELNALPDVQNKTRLIMMDALNVVIEGGPRWNRQWLRPQNALLFATDPVALDRVLLEMIETYRKEEGLGSVFTTARHVQLAGALGLGESRLDKIQVIEKTIG